ncbi:hypothetical protein SPRG_00962 [Saprolegnia parasitica CBS 223.65]|uniref:Histidine acid phosphatase n=1 Tax=Saprolegnia parasitica (strain CBS 223.65) TaxID=695850 RepID=A0A067CWL6_SAPPC|nr:hypothetical protein SPRG_00962 [Saprolegnia parasitica CBS 223.65]KDO34903.1 hypothetical protein SPRG_00962 [Saprolegnia parasitica CBS 223.65]|eukprot:XP_012194562.1 hypothetical protein SPRG_00962 [Saprolegnia parasitica CBS 223.65]
MEGMMRRGQALRERYDHFLGDAEPHDVYIVSTNITRTIRSAQSVVRGLFPDAPRFQVHTMAPQFLTPIHSGLEYKAFGLHANAVAHATRPGYEALEAEMKALLAIPDDQALHWTVVRDMLVCRKAHGLPVPDGLHDALYDAACDHNAWEWHLLYNDPKQAQRGFVRGLAEIQAHLESIVEKDIDHRLTIISAHDNTLVALVCALGLQIGNVIPNYGAILAMEIYENTSTNEHFVLVRFEDDTVTFTGETTPMVPFTAMKRRFDSFAATHAATSAL